MPCLAGVEQEAQLFLTDLQEPGEGLGQRSISTGATTPRLPCAVASGGDGRRSSDDPDGKFQLYPQGRLRDDLTK